MNYLAVPFSYDFACKTGGWATGPGGSSKGRGSEMVCKEIEDKDPKM